MLPLIFTLRIPGSNALRDSRYTTCMGTVKLQTRYIISNFKALESIPGRGSCPQLSVDENGVDQHPSYDGFYCPPGWKLKEQTDNNLCCK